MCNTILSPAELICIKMGSGDSRFNVSLLGWGGGGAAGGGGGAVTTVSIKHNLSKRNGRAESNRGRSAQLLIL